MRNPSHLSESLKDIRSTLIIRNESHTGLEMDVRIEAVGSSGSIAPSVRAASARGGDMFYDVKRNRFTFKGLVPGTYNVRIKSANKQLTRQVNLVAGQTLELSALLGHAGSSFTEAALVDKLTCLDTQLSVMHPAGLDYKASTFKAERIAPTARFLRSLKSAAKSAAPRGRKHTVDGPVTIWRYHPQLKEYPLPLEQILERESTYLRTHIPFYTATSLDKLILQDFFRELMCQAFPDDEALSQVWWLRNPLELPPKLKRYGHMWDFVCAVGGPRNIVDNRGDHAYMLLACNAHVFGNTLHDSQESTADYYYDGMSVIQIKIFEHIQNFLTGMKLVDAKCSVCKASLKQWQERLVAALEKAQPAAPPRGVLFQVFVPFERVNQVAYISKTSKGDRANGQPDDDNPNALQTLLRIQSNEASLVDNYDTLQVRLFTPALMDPDHPLPVFRYTNTDDDAMSAFQAEVAKVVGEVLGQGANHHLSDASH